MPQPKQITPRTNAPILVLVLVIIIGAASFLLFSLVFQNSNTPDQSTQFVSGAAATPVSTGVVVETPSSTELPSTTLIPTATDEVILGTPVYVSPVPTHATGPTAQFDEVLPIEQWLTFTDEKVGYSIKYPPDWYLETTPPDAIGICCSSSIYSYDPKDPSLETLGKEGKWPSNYVAVHFAVADLRATVPSLAFEPNESMGDWVHRVVKLRDIDTVIEEREMTISGMPAYLQVVAAPDMRSTAALNIRKDENNVLTIFYPYKAGGALEQSIEKMLATFQFMR